MVRCGHGSCLAGGWRPVRLGAPDLSLRLVAAVFAVLYFRGMCDYFHRARIRPAAGASGDRKNSSANARQFARMERNLRSDASPSMATPIASRSQNEAAAPAALPDLAAYFEPD